MKVRKHDGQNERRILVGMVVDDHVCASVAAQWHPEGLFRSEWADLVAGWCVAYHGEYGKAPNRDIEGLFQSWAQHRKRDDTVDAVERLLRVLSDEYESGGVNSQYVLDLAGDYFNDVALERLAEDIRADLDQGDREAALGRVDRFGGVQVGRGVGVRPFLDQQAVQAAMEESSEVVVQYPGALGEFLGDALQRDGFISFMAPEKRGKTFWLLDVAWVATAQRRRVAFFQVGDLSQNQMVRRMAIRAARHPQRPGVLRVPRSMDREADTTASPEVLFEERQFEHGLDWRTAWAGLQRANQRSVGGGIRLSVHPSMSLTVDGMASILDTWDRVDGWSPDVVVVDYADILASPGSTEDSRAATNRTWAKLRGLSQQRHCLVVTATQADAASYTADTLGRANFSEDKRKFAHVTGMLGINQNDAEWAIQVQRLNWLVLRDADHNPSRCVYVAGCLGLARPHIRSCH